MLNFIKKLQKREIFCNNRIIFMRVCLGGGFMKKDIEMSLARLPADIQAFVKRKAALCITIFC